MDQSAKVKQRIIIKIISLPQSCKLEIQRGIFSPPPQHEKGS
jgi:hypothetical protein